MLLEAAGRGQHFQTFIFFLRLSNQFNSFTSPAQTRRALQMQ